MRPRDPERAHVEPSRNQKPQEDERARREQSELVRGGIDRRERGFPYCARNASGECGPGASVPSTSRPRGRRAVRPANAQLEVQHLHDLARAALEVLVEALHDVL